ncbi:hypothetical protein ACFE04_019890 [Oxalis oulophora]
MRIYEYGIVSEPHQSSMGDWAPFSVGRGISVNFGISFSNLYLVVTVDPMGQIFEKRIRCWVISGSIGKWSSNTPTGASISQSQMPIRSPDFSGCLQGLIRFRHLEFVPPPKISKF